MREKVYKEVVRILTSPEIAANISYDSYSSRRNFFVRQEIGEGDDATYNALDIYLETDKKILRIGGKSLRGFEVKLSDLEYNELSYFFDQAQKRCEDTFLEYLKTIN